MTTPTQTTTDLRIYFAGKIAKNDWRHQLAPRTNLSLDGYENTGSDDADRVIWPELPIRSWQGARALYVGPFFMGCDHGCFHGPSAHGVAAGGHACPGPGMTRRGLVANCFHAIDRCDAFFAWLDDPTAHGTLVELGFAAARHKHIVVATHPHISDAVRKDMWFAFAAASEVLTAQSPVEAFNAVNLNALLGLAGR